MQRKQQVGECWVCVRFFAFVCGSVIFDNCIFAILADFVIFSSFLN
jgi:hypothetical protein